MERSEAQRLRDRMAAEHPDRRTQSFILSELDGIWTVAKVALPPGLDSSGSELSAPQPVHDHDPTGLPGSLPNNAAGF